MVDVLPNEKIARLEKTGCKVTSLTLSDEQKRLLDKEQALSFRRLLRWDRMAHLLEAKSPTLLNTL